MLVRVTPPGSGSDANSAMRDTSGSANNLGLISEVGADTRAGVKYQGLLVFFSDTKML